MGVLIKEIEQELQHTIYMEIHCHKGVILAILACELWIVKIHSEGNFISVIIVLQKLIINELL